MIRTTYLIAIFSFTTFITFGQKVNYKVDKTFKQLNGEWINDSTNTDLFQGEIGLLNLQLFETDTTIENYSSMLSKYMDDYGVNGFVSDDVALRFLSYGKIVFDSYKFNEKITRQAYCGIFKMADEDHFLMFTDLEDENQFIGLLFSYEFQKDKLIITHKEFGKIGFLKK